MSDDEQQLTPNDRKNIYNRVYRKHKLHMAPEGSIRPKFRRVKVCDMTAKQYEEHLENRFKAMKEQQPEGPQPQNQEQQPEGPPPQNHEQQPEGPPPQNHEQQPEGPPPQNHEQQPEGPPPQNHEQQPEEPPEPPPQNQEQQPEEPPPQNQEQQPEGPPPQIQEQAQEQMPEPIHRDIPQDVPQEIPEPRPSTSSAENKTNANVPVQQIEDKSNNSQTTIGKKCCHHHRKKHSHKKRDLTPSSITIEQRPKKYQIRINLNPPSSYSCTESEITNVDDRSSTQSYQISHFSKKTRTDSTSRQANISSGAQTQESTDGLTVSRQHMEHLPTETTSNASLSQSNRGQFVQEKKVVLEFTPQVNRISLPIPVTNWEELQEEHRNKSLNTWTLPKQHYADKVINYLDSIQPQNQEAMSTYSETPYMEKLPKQLPGGAKSDIVSIQTKRSTITESNKDKDDILSFSNVEQSSDILESTLVTKENEKQDSKSVNSTVHSEQLHSEQSLRYTQGKSCAQQQVYSPPPHPQPSTLSHETPPIAQKEGNSSPKSISPVYTDICQKPEILLPKYSISILANPMRSNDKPPVPHKDTKTSPDSMSNNSPLYMDICQETELSVPEHSISLVANPMTSNDHHPVSKNEDNSIPQWMSNSSPVYMDTQREQNFSVQPKDNTVFSTVQDASSTNSEYYNKQKQAKQFPEKCETQEDNTNCTTTTHSKLDNTGLTQPPPDNQPLPDSTSYNNDVLCATQKLWELKSTEPTFGERPWASVPRAPPSSPAHSSFTTGDTTDYFTADDTVNTSFNENLASLQLQCYERDDPTPANFFNILNEIQYQTDGAKGEDDYEDRRKDHISHFILRLAYCRSEELRRWFIQQEMDLFRFRFSQESDTSIQVFLKINHLNYTPIPEAEKNSLIRALTDSTPGQTASKVNSCGFYKVPFTDVLDLVRQRRVFVKGGYAYVPHSDLVLIILSHFRSSLSHALAVTQRALPHLEEDDRLIPLLGSLSKRYLGQDYTNKKPTTGEVTADMIDTLAKKSFPMCMLHVHQSLRQHHHLRHWGRMQYGLFLKAIGLSLEEAMKFWRAEFIKMVDPDKFEKQYAYNIRHNYGKEGKRADYTPYSCIKIITTNAPATGDYHGCPFKHSDVDLLRQKLQGLRVSKDAIEEISDLVKRHHYQVACGRYFEHTHNVNFGFSPNHPNQYYEESQKILNGGKPEGMATPQRGTPVIVRSQKTSQSTPASQISQAAKSVEDEFEDFPLSAMELDMAMADMEEGSA